MTSALQAGYALPVNYAEATSYIFDRSDFERRTDPQRSSERFTLTRVRRLCELLGNPQNTFASVHIAGTKGKGSTAAMIHSALLAAGIEAGLYTSPHLHSVRERIRVGQELITEDEFAQATAEVARVIAQAPDLSALTTFEVLTAVAFHYFAGRGVPAAVIETGLGGRLDATNIITPLVAVITSISLDHTSILGDSIAAIAREKAGIIKPGAVVVSPPQPSEAETVLTEVASVQGADLRLGGRDWRWRPDTASSFTVEGRFAPYRGLRPGLRGRHQMLNAATAVVALEALREQGLAVERGHVVEGIETVRWPGRLEVVTREPTVVVDGAHNGESALRLREALAEQFRYERLYLVLATSADKDIGAIVEALAPVADRVIVTRSRHSRGAAVETLLEHCRKRAIPAEAAPSIAAAVAEARRLATARDLVCVTGSLFAVAEAREAFGLTDAR